MPGFLARSSSLSASAASCAIKNMDTYTLPRWVDSTAWFGLERIPKLRLETPTLALSRITTLTVTLTSSYEKTIQGRGEC